MKELRSALGRGMRGIIIPGTDANSEVAYPTFFSFTQLRQLFIKS
ncbi:Uncharacterised protein [uncultured archaeon]|nr:Uncharacterised protein [uncultured archaeon]